MGAGAGIVTDPDTEVLDLQWALLMDLPLLEPFQVLLFKATHHIQADDLSVRLFNLPQLHQEVPETRLRNHGVGCKYSHAVQLWCWVCL